jgi:Misato Segment II tubulin-like domain
MKEILYIQAGELSNYTGTHFWNTQESYLALNEFQDYTEVDSSVSFCENVDDKVSVCDISSKSSLIHL